MIRFVLVSTRAKGHFSLDDLPSSGGRMDAMVAALRAALMVSDGLRNATVYLALLGDPEGTIAVRFSSRELRFLRPDERSLARVISRAIAYSTRSEEFQPARPGIAVAYGAHQAIEREIEGAPWCALDRDGEDLEKAPPFEGNEVFFVGDPYGIDITFEKRLVSRSARRLSLGPVSLHGSDAIAVLWNRLDRQRVRKVGAV